MRTFTRLLDKLLRNKLEGIIKVANGIDETAAILTLKKLAVSFAVFYGFGNHRKSERNKAMLSFSKGKFSIAGCLVGGVLFNLVDLIPSFFLFKVSICLRSLSLLAHI